MAASFFTLESRQFGLTATVGAMGRVKTGLEYELVNLEVFF